MNPPISTTWAILVHTCISSVLSDVSGVDRLFFTHVRPEVSYIYPAPPLPPVQLDEPSSLPPPIYLPPVEIQPPQAGYLPPLPSDDTIVIPAQPPPNSYLPPLNQDLQPHHFKIENMSCVQGMNFRATFKMAFSDLPVVDDAHEGCIKHLPGNSYRIDLESLNNMLKCGVRRCQSGKMKAGEENMCVVVRVPTVRGIRLPEDKTVTLMCVPQERVVSQIRHVKLGNNKIQPVFKARSNDGVIATGGTKKDLKTQIGIFKKRPGSAVFDQNVQADSLIELGEELLLRTIINEGDGWKNSLIGPVQITGLNSKKSAVLVNQQGCVNPEMKSICPRQPVRVNPLVTELNFRAFLFQEEPQGDEMVVSVRTQGCVQAQDCLRAPCVGDFNVRAKRSFIETDVRNTSKGLKSFQNWELQVFFKVLRVVRGEVIKTNIMRENFRNHNFLILCICLVGVAFSLIIIIVWGLFRCMPF
ncbi:uncharacterized protein [Euwallacea similis]|uniref:uncharacterized protein n=1 Tax=Euwallacea similis TaxID=1736056 RepID=UPI00345035F6